MIHKPNGGVSSARNEGLATATGEFVCFVDSDDEVDSNYVAVMYEQMVATNADLAVCAVDLYTLTSKQTDAVPERILDMDDMSVADCQSLLLESYMWWACNKMFRRAIMDRYGLRYDSKVAFGEDCILGYQYILHSRRIVFVSQSLYRYRTENFVASYKYYPEMCFIREQIFESEKALIQGFPIVDDEKRRLLAMRTATHLRVAVRHHILYATDQKSALRAFEESYAYFFLYFQSFLNQKDIFDSKVWAWIEQYRVELQSGHLRSAYKRWYRAEKHAQKSRGAVKKRIKKSVENC